MRIRATVAAATISGALALTAFAVPAAQAGTGTASDLNKPSAAQRFAAEAPAKHMSAFAAEAEPVVSNVTVNSGQDVVLGTTNLKTFTVSLTASHASGIQDAYIDLWHGSDVDHVDGYLPPNEDAATCTAASATTSTCKLTITVDPRGDLANSLAGSWHVTAGALAGDGSIYWDDYYGKRSVKRYSKLTTNASPEPVKKGKTITVTGSLTRANWDTSKYMGYTKQPVKLQFKKKGASTYSTVKTVTSSSTGGLKTTVTAASDGYWRYNFAGTSTTPAVASTSDFVDVQ
ncbi:calcium-binding protein [Streptomyces sp. CB01635]|uniref:DUF5707 domain-containing protein n=1 Tax=unclassified Streptomyces TaxID=2593676 RepID=UPI000C279B3F|nr:DUF5707 domain-containing protein [Streptomyces sp. CB01635]PJN09204.1 calcium-binding protein [Streptomyces sp. CB01635]